MKLKHLITATSLCLLPLAANATNFVIPAAGTGPGANGSRWQTEITLHNSSSSDGLVVLKFRDQNSASDAFVQRVPARHTLTLDDVVRTIFKRESATGAIEVLDESNSLSLAVTSRTLNVSDAGEFGQDVPAIDIASAARAGDVVAVTGPSAAARYRFNFGLYVIGDTSVQWELIRADGSVGATVDASYSGGTQHQYNYGVSALFNITPRDNDVIHATVTKGSAFFYGSMINEQSGDPTFVPGIRTRVDSRLRLTGIDRDDNGSVDIVDANRDGVLDAAVDSYTFGFPTYFRIVAQDENGGAVKYEIVSSTADARLIDDRGSVQLVASAALKGTTGELRVRITAADGQSTVITIPVKFF